MPPESTPKPPVLRALGLRVDAGPLRLLDAVDLTVATGEVVVVTGETGAGKTTLLDAIAGMSPHRVEGTLEVLGTDGLCPHLVGRLRGRTLGVLRQDIRGWYSPYRRVGAQILEGWAEDSGAGRAQVDALLARFALPAERIWSRFPNQLSDGMLRRAALAGLLARRPALVIADEPTAGLDGPARWRAWELLLESSGAVLAATHDLEMVAALTARGQRLKTVRIEGRTIRSEPQSREG